MQIIPTAVFFLLFLAMIPTTPFIHSLNEALASSMKAGYWFTLVLLYMLLTFYLFSYVESKIFRGYEGTGARGRENTPAPPIFIILLFIISLCLFETCYLPRQFSWAMGHKGPPNEFMNYSSLVEMIRYFPFFLYGAIVHRYWDRAQRLMGSSRTHHHNRSDQVALLPTGVGLTAPHPRDVPAADDGIYVLQALQRLLLR